MNTAGTSATIVKEELLKALADELGFILYPASRTFSIFRREYIFARVETGRRSRSSRLLQFPRTQRLG
jgi:hypothetical protein